MNEEDNEEVRAAGTSEAKFDQEAVTRLAGTLSAYSEEFVAQAVRKAFPGSNVWRWGEAREAFPEEAGRISYRSEAVTEEEARATQEDHQRSEAGGP